MNIFVCNDEEAKMAWLHNHDYFCRARVVMDYHLTGLLSGTDVVPLLLFSHITCVADDSSLRQAKD
jgi:hypothetical protein